MAFRFTELDEAEYECLDSYFDYYMEKLEIKYHKDCTYNAKMFLNEETCEKNV